jgi:hypothetical protein
MNPTINNLVRCVKQGSMTSLMSFMAAWHIAIRGDGTVGEES